MTNEHKKYILNLLNMLKPCNCDEFIRYAADVTFDDDTVVEDQWIGMLDVNVLTDVMYRHNDAIAFIESDNLRLHCSLCGADWTAWNYLLDERTRSALSHLAPVEE